MLGSKFFEASVVVPASRVVRKSCGSLADCSHEFVLTVWVVHIDAIDLLLGKDGRIIRSRRLVRSIAPFPGAGTVTLPPNAAEAGPSSAPAGAFGSTKTTL